MTTQDQIKAIAADFLRALATVPGLFARWQADTSADVRGAIVRDELGLDYTPNANDLARMAEFTQPQVSAGALRGTPNFTAFAHEKMPAMQVILVQAAMQVILAHEAVPA